jgi:hypothetical protein
MRLGSIKLASDPTEALKYYQQCLVVYQAQAKADPDNMEAQYGLAIGYGKLSDGYNHSGDQDKSMAAAQQGLAIMTRLIKLAPDNQTWNSTLTYFNKRIAFLTQHAQK